MIIYKITNVINGKVYIGQTINSLEKRWKRHTWKSSLKRESMAISMAILKYGKENFIIEEIYKAISIHDLNDKEAFYIEEYNSISPNGYNLLSGGNNSYMSEETKTKISKSHKKRWESGFRISEETRNKLSESHKGWVPSEETRQKWRNAFSGKPPSDNTIKASIETHQKTYTLLSPDGNLVTFTNMSKFCKENGLSDSKLCLVASGKRNNHRGWKRPLDIDDSSDKI